MSDPIDPRELDIAHAPKRAGGLRLATTWRLAAWLLLVASASRAQDALREAEKGHAVEALRLLAEQQGDEPVACSSVAERLARAGLHEPALEAARRSNDYYRAWGLHAVTRARALEGDLGRALDTALSIEGWEREPLDASRLRATLAALSLPLPSAAPAATQAASSVVTPEKPLAATTDLRSLDPPPACVLPIDALESAVSRLSLSAGQAELEAARQAARALTDEPCPERPRLDERLFDTFSYIARRGLEEAGAYVAGELAPELQGPALLGLALGLAECGQGEAARARLADRLPSGR